MAVNLDFQSQGWSETEVKGHAQCTFMNPTGQVFIVRQYGEYEWTAINISVGTHFCGQIIANGQSDAECYKKAVKEISRDV